MGSCWGEWAVGAIILFSKKKRLLGSFTLARAWQMQKYCVCPKAGVSSVKCQADLVCIFLPLNVNSLHLLSHVFNLCNELIVLHLSEVVRHNKLYRKWCEPPFTWRATGHFWHRSAWLTNQALLTCRYPGSYWIQTKLWGALFSSIAHS